MGIEPTLSAWKAEVLPLNYTRAPLYDGNAQNLVEGVGFEPTKAEPADLQSAPFDRSGTPPERKLPIIFSLPTHVKPRRSPTRGTCAEIADQQLRFPRMNGDTAAISTVARKLKRVKQAQLGHMENFENGKSDGRTRIAMFQPDYFQDLART